MLHYVAENPWPGVGILSVVALYFFLKMRFTQDGVYLTRLLVTIGLIVGFLVMKALAKTAKASSVMVHALPNGTLMASGGRSAGSVASESFTHDSHTSHHTEADVANGIQALAKRNDYDDVASIEERQNLPLEQLKRMASERPESVAMLIKSWMLEERR